MGRMCTKIKRGLEDITLIIGGRQHEEIENWILAIFGTCSHRI